MIDLKYINKIDHIYPYPAKYTVSMLENYIKKYTKPNDIILDPFVGSGTTLLAARWLERKSIGFDINPIAYHISKVKTNTYILEDKKIIKKFIEYLVTSFNDIDKLEFELINYESINHWFKYNVIKALSAIKYCINSNIKEERIIDLCNLAFSYVVLPLSNQESDTRYKAIQKEDLSINEILNIYINKLEEMLNIVILGKDLNTKSKVYLLDALKINSILKTESIDFLITSPPYPNTYDYYLYHKHRMLFLGYDFKPVMETEIGSRREFSSLKKDSEKFTQDLFNIFKSANETLKNDAYIVVIIGDGKIAGEKYDSKEHMIQIAKKLNWELIEEKYTELDKTSKKFQQSFRTKGKKEYFLVFKKRGKNE